MGCCGNFCLPQPVSDGSRDRAKSCGMVATGATPRPSCPNGLGRHDYAYRPLFGKHSTNTAAFAGCSRFISLHWLCLSSVINDTLHIMVRASCCAGTQQQTSQSGDPSSAPAEVLLAAPPLSASVTVVCKKRLQPVNLPMTPAAPSFMTSSRIIEITASTVIMDLFGLL